MDIIQLSEKNLLTTIIYYVNMEEPIQNRDLDYCISLLNTYIREFNSGSDSLHEKISRIPLDNPIKKYYSSFYILPNETKQSVPLKVQIAQNLIRKINKYIDMNETSNFDIICYNESQLEDSIVKFVNKIVE